DPRRLEPRLGPGSEGPRRAPAPRPPIPRPDPLLLRKYGTPLLRGGRRQPPPDRHLRTRRPPRFARRLDPRRRRLGVAPVGPLGAGRLLPRARRQDAGAPDRRSYHRDL